MPLYVKPVRKPEADGSKHHRAKSPVEGADPKVTIICRFSPTWPMNITPYFGQWTLLKCLVLGKKIKINNNFKKSVNLQGTVDLSPTQRGNHGGHSDRASLRMCLSLTVLPPGVLEEKGRVRQ